MKTLIFIQANDQQLYYKCDTFWSTSVKIYLAKVYSSCDPATVNNLIQPYEYSIQTFLKKNPEKLNTIIEKYNGCKMGYRNVDEELLDSGGYTIRKNVTDNQLGQLNYTHQITINGLEPSIIDIRREEKINKIIKNELDN
jgi:hypothetical protein